MMEDERVVNQRAMHEIGEKNNIKTLFCREREGKQWEEYAKKETRNERGRLWRRGNAENIQTL